MRQRLPRTLILICASALGVACGAPAEAPPADATRAAPIATPDSATALRAPTPEVDTSTSHDPGQADLAPALDVRRVADDGTERKRATRPPGERPLPDFAGRTLAGTHLSISSLIGKRLLIFFFNPEDRDAKVVARAVAEVSKQAQRNNFDVVGVGIGSSIATVRSFSREAGLDFPVIDDSSGDISYALRLQSRILVIGVDSEGYVSFVHPGFNTERSNASELIAAQLRESLRIQAPAPQGADPLLARPKAPDFETTDLDGKPFSMAELTGRPKILIFFLHTCPHCHHALAFFKEALEKIPGDKRPALVAVSLQNRPSAIRIALDEEGLDFFRVLVDPGGEISESYGLKGGVPDISVINAAGEIEHRIRGWRDDRDPPLMRMYLAKVSGERVPMLLAKKGFTGNDACVVCHENETASWAITSHARAFDTLVTHGDNRDPECVSCHVVGFDQLGGYSFAKPADYLESVGCESCHERGGGHLDAERVPQDYVAVCETCHDKKHSLGFDFASFSPLISHKAIAALSPEERAKRYGAEGQARDLLPSKTDFVGSNACAECHKIEFETWSQSPHAHALTSLVSKQSTGDADCLACHTTGFGKTGGFPKGGDANAETDLARVGCESCHGPGAEHMKEEVPKLGSIVSLGDKCDSCVILQICGTCHDEANDPDFEFQVEEHIERQRHGTIEPGTGKPLGTTASRSESGVEARVVDLPRRVDAEG